MRWWDEWSTLTRAQAWERAQQWWDSKSSRLAWLDESLADAGLVLAWDDDTSVLAAWHWLVAIAASPQTTTPSEPLPIWYDVSSAEFAPKFGPLTAIAGDALAHSLEAYLRAQRPRLERALGPRPRGKVHWEGQNEPTLVLPEYREFSVYEGFEEANRFALRATHPTADPTRDARLLQVRRDAALESYETAVRKSETDPAEAEPEFEVERSSDPDYRWELWLGPLLAVDAEAEVSAFTSALQRVPGVTEVYHQDREQLQVAGKVTKKALIEFTREWWRTQGAGPLSKS